MHGCKIAPTYLQVRHPVFDFGVRARERFVTVELTVPFSADVKLVSSGRVDAFFAFKVLVILADAIGDVSSRATCSPTPIALNMKNDILNNGRCLCAGRLDYSSEHVKLRHR